MLKEYLLKTQDGQAVWTGGMPGVQVCRFALDREQTDRQIPVQGRPLHFETLFCLGGQLTIQPCRGEIYRVQAPGIFLLSDSSGLRACRCSGDLSGVLVAVDAAAAKESLMQICATLGLELDTSGVKRKMAAKSGGMVLADMPWTEAFFAHLQCLPQAAQARYCVFKAVELLYLLCSQDAAAVPPEAGAAGVYPPRLLEVQAYLQAHLCEKMTIAHLCRRFAMSPTVLKSDFRRAFGVPIHSWLVQQRLKRARELLCTTQMPVQQVAQSVGYQGMSQFNAAFKRQYAMTPGQARKMSQTVTPRPF